MFIVQRYQWLRKKQRNKVDDGWSEETSSENNNNKKDNSNISNNSNAAGKFSILLLLLLVSISITKPTEATTVSDSSLADQDCKTMKKGEICSREAAKVCQNNTCQSVCKQRGMRECPCVREDDAYCYLCCGDATRECKPAHSYDIMKPNGERWERDECGRCRKSPDMEGLSCADNDQRRLCHDGKCTTSICYNKRRGEHCDKKMEKICVENECKNPCSQFGQHLMVCDCDEVDKSTGFATEDRCQLCCYDFTAPSHRRCENAYRKYGAVTSDKRPIIREGLSCVGGRTCNKFGVCAGSRLIPNDIYQLLITTLIATFIVSYLRRPEALQ